MNPRSGPDCGLRNQNGERTQRVPKADPATKRHRVFGLLLLLGHYAVGHYPAVSRMWHRPGRARTSAIASGASKIITTGTATSCLYLGLPTLRPGRFSQQPSWPHAAVRV